jgi:hypothetical protein
MEFAFRRPLILTIVLLCVSATAQVSKVSQQVRVLVYDNARVSGVVLERAGLETTRIFRSAGIDLLWINCTSTVDASACRSMSKSKELILRVVPKGKSAADSVYGDAFLADDGSGKYADIFFDRIAATYRNYGVNESSLLGAVAAHEIGHLLLGLGAHSTTGIMSPVWANDLIQRLEKGAMLFTPEQAMHMRKRMAKSEFDVDDRRLNRSKAADLGGRVGEYEAPYEFKSATFLSGNRCTQTLSPCP